MSETLQALLGQITVGPLNWTAAVNRCPFCQRETLSVRGRRTTLVGGGNGSREGDPNHVWEDVQCGACGQSCVRETKRGAVWFTALDQVLAGLPACFESYAYPCRCGGRITRTAEVPSGQAWMTLDTRYTYACDHCGMSYSGLPDHLTAPNPETIE